MSVVCGYIKYTQIICFFFRLFATLVLRTQFFFSLFCIFCIALVTVFYLVDVFRRFSLLLFYYHVYVLLLYSWFSMPLISYLDGILYGSLCVSLWIVFLFSSCCCCRLCYPFCGCRSLFDAVVVLAVTSNKMEKAFDYRFISLNECYIRYSLLDFFPFVFFSLVQRCFGCSLYLTYTTKIPFGMYVFHSLCRPLVSCKAEKKYRIR